MTKMTKNTIAVLARKENIRNILSVVIASEKKIVFDALYLRERDSDLACLDILANNCKETGRRLSFEDIAKELTRLNEIWKSANTEKPSSVKYIDLKNINGGLS